MFPAQYETNFRWYVTNARAAILNTSRSEYTIINIHDIKNGLLTDWADLQFPDCNVCY